MKIILPLCIILPRRKKNQTFYLNLNFYRNAHFQILNQAKVIYHTAVKVLNPGLKLSAGPPYSFIYTLYPRNKGRVDLGNVLSIVQKFTEDALVEMGVIPDDDYKIIREVTYKIGQIDKENPRAELEIWR